MKEENMENKDNTEKKKNRGQTLTCCRTDTRLPTQVFKLLTTGSENCYYTGIVKNQYDNTICLRAREIVVVF